METPAQTIASKVGSYLISSFEPGKSCEGPGLFLESVPWSRAAVTGKVDSVQVLSRSSFQPGRTGIEPPACRLKSQMPGDCREFRPKQANHKEVQAGAGLGELQRFGKGKASSRWWHVGHSKRIRAGIDFDVPSTGCCGNGRGT
jgi:hypothetical protein